MANIKLKQLFDGVANAIREKDKTVEEIIAKDFPDRIRAIPTVSGDAKLQRKNVEVTQLNQIVNPDVGYDGMTQVEITSIKSSIDKNIKSENILSGTTILGVEGTAKPYKDPTLQSKNVNPSTQTQTVTFDNGYDGLSSVSVNGVNSSIDNNIIAENIRDGVEILGVRGSMTTSSTPAKLQNKEAEISSIGQIITPDGGNDGLKQVKITKINSSVDANLKPENISAGVSILGVEGTMAPLKAQSGIFVISNRDELIYLPCEKGDIAIVYDKNGAPIDRDSIRPLSIVKTIYLPSGFYFYPSGQEQTIIFNNKNTADTFSVHNYISPYGENQSIYCLDIECTSGEKEGAEAPKTTIVKYFSQPFDKDGFKEGVLIDFNAEEKTELGEPISFPVAVDFKEPLFLNTTKAVYGKEINWLDCFREIGCKEVGTIREAYISNGYGRNWDLAPEIAKPLCSYVIHPRTYFQYREPHRDNLDIGGSYDPLMAGYGHIEVLPVTSSIDSDIVPSNIRKGVDILGVTGTYGIGEGSFLGGAFDPKDACHGRAVDAIFAEMQPFHATNGWKCPREITHIPMKNNAYTDETHHIGVPLISCTNVTEGGVGEEGYKKGMFEKCVDIPYLPNLRFENIQDMDSMFKDCQSLMTAEPLMKGDLDKVLSMDNTFEGCKSLIGLPAIDIPNVTSMNYTFAGCSSLLTIPQLWGIEAVANSKVTSMLGIFQDCTNLTFIPQYFDTINVKNMKLAFSGCTNLQEVNIIKTSNVENMILMFHKCPNLSDTALNNILRMCINAVKVPETVEGKRIKCLYFDETNIKTGSAGIGLSREQIERCMMLPNWDEFRRAGWTAGI